MSVTCIYPSVFDRIVMDELRRQRYDVAVTDIVRTDAIWMCILYCCIAKATLQLNRKGRQDRQTGNGQP